MAKATATRKRRPAKQVIGGAVNVPKATATEFLVFEDNAGDYHWEIVAAAGECLTRSGSFASHDDAERAARYVYDCARSARFEPSAGEERPLVSV